VNGNDDLAKTVGCILLVVLLVGFIIFLVVYLPRLTDLS
jgi:preprotein translocase subunit Sss1